MHCILLAGAAASFGIFCPAIARKIKALFSKEATAAKTAATSAASGAVTAAVASAVSDVKKAL